MIRAVYHQGNIEPIDTVPPDWTDGQELVVDAVVESPLTETFEEWAAELGAATASITDEDHARFLAALEEVEKQSKELGRREIERMEPLP